MAVKEKKQNKPLEAGSYELSQVKTVPIDIPYDEIVTAVKKGKAYVLEPELTKAVVMRGAKKLEKKFEVKVRVEKVVGTEQFVMLPE